MGRIVLEVIVQSLADAKAAREGGADRLEIVRSIGDGGLTPALDLVDEIASAVDLPLRVMVRENDGFAIRDGELRRLQDAARWLERANVDGIVTGFADRGRPSMRELQAVLSAAPHVNVTFHRAFDTLADPDAAIAVLAGLGQVDRILTSGGDGTADERAARLARYTSLSRLVIVAGGGVDLDAAAVFAGSGFVREVHVGRAARAGKVQDAPVSAACVAGVRAILDRPTAHQLPNV
jgi:copper homeostasis protein